MTIQNIKDAIASHKPIVVKLSNGDQFIVPHEDFLSFLPPVAGQVFVLVEATGRFHIIDAEQVVAVTLERQNA